MEKFYKAFQAVAEEHGRHISRNAGGRRSKAYEIIDRNVDECKEAINRGIDRQKKVSGLKTFMDSDCPRIIKQTEGSIAEQINGQVVREITNFNNQYAKAAEKCLDLYRRNIGALSVHSAEFQYSSSAESISMPKLPTLLLGDAFNLAALAAAAFLAAYFVEQ